MSMPKPLNILPDEPAPTIRWAHLRSRHIYADEVTQALLKYTRLTPESLDLVNSVLGLPHRRSLTLRVGIEIGYRAALESAHGCQIEAIVRCADDSFTFPLNITVLVGMDLRLDEHLPSCGYGDPLHETLYTPCQCPFVEYHSQEFIVNLPKELGDVKNYITGLLPNSAI